ADHAVAARRERRAEVVVPEDHLRRQAHDEEEWAALRRAEGLVRDLDAVGARGGHATVPRRACGRRSSACCNRIRAPGMYAIGGGEDEPPSSRMERVGVAGIEPATPGLSGRREKTASPRSSAGSSAGRGLDEARYVERVRRRASGVDGLPAPEPAPASRPRRRTVSCRRGLTTTSARPRPARRV